MKWELEEGGTLGAGGEYKPVQYPRSDWERDTSAPWNKGGASQTKTGMRSSEINTDGNTNVPRHADTPIDYYDSGDGKGGDGAVTESRSGDEGGNYSQ